MHMPLLCPVAGVHVVSVATMAPVTPAVESPCSSPAPEPTTTPVDGSAGIGHVERSTWSHVGRRYYVDGRTPRLKQGVLNPGLAILIFQKYSILVFFLTQCVERSGRLKNNLPVRLNRFADPSGPLIFRVN